MRFATAGAAGLALIVWMIGVAHAQTAGGNDPGVASTPPRTPDDERKAFHLPPGFDIELVAAEPEIHKPLNLAFDDRGRLWVTETVEYPFPAQPGARSRDAVKVLSDFGPDGRARSVTTFADGLNIPIGVLPLGGGSEALVHSIPNILHLADTDGDGKADRRDVFYASYGFRDTHGMTNAFTWGFDGWIYACHGFSNESTVRGSDRRAITMQSGNVYRMRPDGSHLEYVTHGQVNPFGLAFDPLGNLFSCDCHSRPIYQLLRGAYYPSFGKPDDGLGFGPEMVTHDHGSTAISGIVYYAADHFPKAYRDTIFIGNVVTNRINHDRLEPHGSTLLGIEQPDFLTSDDPWFRPADLELGPDGAIYVADFYNRIIGHYEVPLTHPGRDRERGRIWRIVYRGPDGQARPAAPRSDWTRASVAELVQDLGHPNLSVRIKATNTLVDRNDRRVGEAVGALLSGTPAPWSRAHALWVLDRRGSLDDPALESAAKDDDPAVRVHAQRILGERPSLSGELHALAVAGLKDSDAFVRRAAAEALGRHPDAGNIRPLLDLRHAVPAADTHLLHMVRMSLRDQLRADSAWSHLPELSREDARDIADVAPGVPTAPAAAFLLRHIRTMDEPDDHVVRYVHHIARYGAGDSARELLAFARDRRPDDIGHQLALLKAIAQGTQERGAKLSPEARDWALALTRKAIAASKNETVLAGIEQAAALKLDPLWEPLRELADRAEAPEPQRRAALTALAAMDPSRAVPALARALEDTAAPRGLREHAANALAGLNSPAAQAELLKELPVAPGPLQASIAFALAATESGARALLDAVAAGKASARLLQEPPVRFRFLVLKKPALQERAESLTKDLPPADAKLQDLIRQRRSRFATARTDPAHGTQVFEKQCALCHQLKGKGARIGPQLDGIGTRGPDRLLEDILDPNRNVDQMFRVTTLALNNGQIASGLLLREEGEVLVLADAQGKEVRVPKDEVEEKTMSRLSPMPANFAEQVPEQDLDDLLAYLLQQRESAAGSK